MPAATKKTLNYRMAEDQMKSCKMCDNFLEPDRCRLLGKVDPAYTCDAFQPANQSGNIGDMMMGMGPQQ